MKRIVMAVGILAAGLLVTTPGTAHANAGSPCQATLVSDVTRTAQFVTPEPILDLVITAAMTSPNPSSTRTSVTCTLHQGAIGNPIDTHTASAPGPAVALLLPIVFNVPPTGMVWYICTYVTSDPGGIQDWGCGIAFIW